MSAAAPGGVEETAVEPVWRCCAFAALTVHELQRIHAARQEVFVVEQRCVFLDADALDEAALHLAAWSATKRLPLAYARLLAPGAKYREASIGRILTTSPARGRGIGRELVARAIGRATESWPGQSIRISAQSRLAAFYRGFGFASVGEAYDEDGIEHVDMLRPAPER